MRKPVFRGFRPGKTQTGMRSQLASLETLDIANIGIVPSMQLITKMLIRLHGCAG